MPQTNAQSSRPKTPSPPRNEAKTHTQSQPKRPPKNPEKYQIFLKAEEDSQKNFRSSSLAEKVLGRLSIFL